MTTYVIADLHLGDATTHARRRDRFASLSAMEREILTRWNAIVTARDSVYMLGDIGKRQGLELVSNLRGIKHLIAGNADDLAAVHQSGLFASVNVARWVPGFLLTHIPVHPSQLRNGTVNVHGHLHTMSLDDPRYACASVEQTDYAPVPLAHLRAQPTLI